MPKLIVKPTVNFLSIDTDIELQTDVGLILALVAKNVEDYPDPYPPLPIVTAAPSDFAEASRAAALGGVVLTLRKNQRRKLLVNLVGQLASYVTVACNGDLVVLLRSGFPIHKPTRNRIGDLSAPAMPTLKRGTLTGVLEARTRSVRGAFIYNWEIALASAPEEILRTPQSTGTKISIPKLISGQIYRVRVNAVGAAGPSNFSGAST
ncbi:MAG: hypothetical protein ACR2NX_14670 [Chthoniobacterales bacterium]